MNQDPEIQKILRKFILNECNPDEIDQVINYFRENKLTSEFPTVDEAKALLDELEMMDKPTADRIFSNILTTPAETKVVTLRPKKVSYKKYIAIAASVIVLLSAGIAYQKGFFTQQEKLILNGTEITLQLENGDIQVISESGKIDVIDANGNKIGTQSGNTITYNSENGIDKLVYNTLKIPYGKRFELKLSDGTSVHLNAGTTLKYPVKFIAGETRQVFLDGEAYFDVTKDKKHPFIVNADKLNVRVLGTHFNVSSYPEDDRTDVVLVEGSVGLYAAGQEFDGLKNTVLKPGYRGSFNKETQEIKTKAVNPEIYTSWMKGELVFKNMSFKNIAKKLERHYNVVIVNKNAKLDNEKFNATFKNETIAKVLSYFSEIHAFNYSVDDNEILIK